ncbi:hypothetical protein Golomagni_03037 [Golovinomyces magnicellulatus]|nr:hypothetical protein Golomagni_03037 [Golovinomyces magnicellulatus]
MTMEWDDWILQDRVRKFTEANKELASQLQYQVKASKSGQQKTSSSKSGKRVTGGRGTVPSSDLSSTRGSEERNASVPLSQSVRGPRRNRDYDVETVSGDDFFIPLFCPGPMSNSEWTRITTISVQLGRFQFV